MAILEFEEVLLPPKIEFGRIGGPQFATDVAATTGGEEQRTGQWELARAKYRSSHRLRTQVEFDELLAFFYAMRGQLTGFRFRDWLDYCSDMAGIIANGIRTGGQNIDLPAAGVLAAQLLGTGSGAGTDFALAKTYANPGAGDNYVRPISKPSTTGTPQAQDPNARVRVYANAVEQTEGALNDYTIDTTTGIVTFNTPPASGVQITADYIYDVPVRFASDLFDGSKDAFNIDNWDGIELVEVRI